MRNKDTAPQEQGAGEGCMSSNKLQKCLLLVSIALLAVACICNSIAIMR